MSTPSDLVGEVSNRGAVMAAPIDLDPAMSMGEVEEVLGISEAGAGALAGAGFLGRAVAPSTYSRAIVEALAERIWRAALVAASDAPGLRLREVVESADRGPALWPLLIAALLDGRINAFRRRGAPAGRIVASLVVASRHVALDLEQGPPDAAEAPFIWTPPRG